MVRKRIPQDGSQLHSPGLPKVNMPPVRAYLTAEVVNAQAARLDESYGVEAQSKSIFEDECEVNIPHTKLSLLDYILETGRMKNFLSREGVTQNERNELPAQPLHYYELHSPITSDGAPTASVSGHDHLPALESDDDADGEAGSEDTVSISSMDACCSTTSEFIGSDLDKQWLLHVPRTHGEISFNPAQLDFPRSPLLVAGICPICQIEDSDEIPAMRTPCCGRFVHDICNDEELEKTVKCWSCEKDQRSSSSSKNWTCSKADEYIVHFATNSEDIPEISSSSSRSATPEQCPSLASSAFGETELSDQYLCNDIGPCSYNLFYLEREEDKALDDLEALKDYFLALWTEVADRVTERDRVRILQEVVTGTKVPVDFHTTKPMVPSPAISFHPPASSESVTIHENQSLQERSQAFSRLRTSLESAMDAMQDLI